MTSKQNSTLNLQANLSCHYRVPHFQLQWSISHCCQTESYLKFHNVAILLHCSLQKGIAFRKFILFPYLAPHEQSHASNASDPASTRQPFCYHFKESTHYERPVALPLESNFVTTGQLLQKSKRKTYIQRSDLVSLILANFLSCFQSLFQLGVRRHVQQTAQLSAWEESEKCRSWHDREGSAKQERVLNKLLYYRYYATCVPLITVMV